MERPIGDKFKLNGCVYVVVEDTNSIVDRYCDACAFSAMFCTNIMGDRGECLDSRRSDLRNVHFEHFGVNF